MAIERRAALRLLAGGVVGSLLPLPLDAEATEGAEAVDRLYLSARADATGGYRVSSFSANGARCLDLPLPGRGHSFAVRPGGHEAVHFARRPGRFALVLDLARGTVGHTVETPGGRHFYGHGVFSRDGRRLYATENDFGGERGVVGVYDAVNDYRRIGELKSHGIGPHDIRLLSDGETLVVANGGIATRPDLPRIKLNLPTMAPSLCLVDRRAGTLLQERRLDPALHQLSIRHLAVGPEDTVAVAMQYEGPAGDLVPLVAVWRGVEGLRLLPWTGRRHARDEALLRQRLLRPERADHRRLGPARRHRDLLGRRQRAATCRPPGSRMAAASHRVKRPAEFLASSGQGGVVVIDARSGTTRPLAIDGLKTARWDNHLVAVSTP